MRFVKNPSYIHGAELVQKFRSYKDLISFKDHTQYTHDLIKVVLLAVQDSKRIGLSKIYILWLTKQIYENKLTEDGVKEDYLPLIKFHFNNKELLKPIESYSSASQLNSDIESLSDEGEVVLEKDLDIFFEKDGWMLSMPHTTKASCLLGKGTSWCTARTKSQNLFLSYVGKYEYNFVLFYLIKIGGNPNKNPNDKISVGFKNGKPTFADRDRTTVNASNEAITIEKFDEIFGKELAQIMLIKMNEKLLSIEGKHPTKKEMEKIAKSVDKYLKKIKEFKDDYEKIAFKQIIAKYNLNKDLQVILSKDRSSIVRGNLASNPSISEALQFKFANAKSKFVKSSLAMNPNLIEALQFTLTNDRLAMVYLSRNPNLVKALQIKLTNGNFSAEDSLSIRYYLSENPALIESIQIKLTSDKNVLVRRNLASNPNIFQSAQIKLINDEDVQTRANLAANPNISKSVQIKLTYDDYDIVLENLAKNPNVSSKIRERIKFDDYLDYYYYDR